MTVLPAIVLIAYVSLALELTLLHVPSVASTSKIWSRDPVVVASYSPSYRGLFSLSRPKKVVLFVLPVLVAYGVYLYPLIAIWGPGEPLGDHAFTASTPTDAVAALLIVAGRAITLGSVFAIRGGSGGAEESTVLRTDGPFRLSRNPGLVGNYVFVGGLWMAAPSITLLGGILAYVVYMDFKVRMEEDYLANRFGKSYDAYRMRTGRYLP